MDNPGQVAPKTVKNPNVYTLFQLALQIACRARACTLEGRRITDQLPDRQYMGSLCNKRAGLLFDLACPRAHPEDDLRPFIITIKEK